MYPLSLSRSVDDHLILRTAGGAVDLLAEEFETHDLRTRHLAALGLRLCGDELAAVHACRLYWSAAIPLAGTPDHEHFLTPLRHSEDHGVLAALTGKPITFRVGTAVPSLRQLLVAGIERDLGWRNDPRACP
ncbi:hypothetical protein [Kribbella amoyensis]|uniref:hypothetical protein n=1 Tax=Kribbella amoyensis TaxID=996641 RepID=UPI00147947AF|nr:hypothetical protein [Kribbella amoyensis]